MKFFSNETLNCVFQKVLFLLHFGSCQNCMSSMNVVTEIHYKLCNTRGLSTGEPCTCEYVTFLQSFHRGTLSIHCYIVRNLAYRFHVRLIQPTVSMSVLFRRFFRTAIFSRCSVLLEKDFVFHFHKYFLLVLLFISSFQIHNLELAQ